MTRDWKKATGTNGKLAKHESSASHRAAADDYTARKQASKSSVAVHLSQAYAERLQREKEQKEENRTALMSIIDIIRFLVRQNISLRGHDESASSLNRGNFLELVHFTAKYNTSLQKWIDSHPGNVSWMSHDIQNELIHLLSTEVITRIANECKGRFFSIMCDEVSDRSNNELLSLVVRYTLDSGKVNEALIALVKVDSTAGADLCDVIVRCLNGLQFDLNMLIAQCYDGASNMSGRYSGVQARLKSLCLREPLFVHCWTHVLNLVIQDVVKSVPLCSRTFELLQKIYVVVEGSPKRHSEYMTCVVDLHLDDGLQALQSLSATRWAARSVNLRIVQRCLAAIIKYLEAQSDADSRGLLASISDFRFVFGVEFLVELFVLVNSTSLALQSQDTDLHLAGSSVGNLTASIAALRSDASFKRLFATAKLRCEELNIDMMKATDKPRKRKVPTALRGSCMLSSFLTLSSDAVPSNSAEEELENRTKLDFFLPVIDAASSSIDRRFNAECLSVLKHISSLMATWPEVKTSTMLLDNFAVLQSWTGSMCCSLQKATCCSTMRHTDPLIVR